MKTPTKPRIISRRMTLQAAEEKIKDLRRSLIPASCDVENLDAPVDSDFRVSSAPSRHLFEMIQNDMPVSWCTIVDFNQQIRGGVLRMGGIAGVRTHDDHRFQGHSRRVMINSLRWMRQAGFDVAMLYGITGFYPKFGYANAFPNTAFTLAVRDAELVAPNNNLRVIDYSPKHLRSVLSMYHKNNEKRSGPTRRDAKLWVPFRKGVAFRSKCIVKVLADRQNRAQGYFVYDAEPLTATLIETGFATPEVFPVLLRAMASHAWNQRLEKMRFVLPEDDAFVDYCKPLGLQMEKNWKKDGGPMVRMLNIPSAFQKISGALASRLRGEGKLTIRTNLDSVTLICRSGKMKVLPAERSGLTASMPQWALAQLLYGYRAPASLQVEGKLMASGRALETLAELFPAQPHFHYLVDQF